MTNGQAAGRLRAIAEDARRIARDADQLAGEVLSGAAITDGRLQTIRQHASAIAHSAADVESAGTRLERERRERERAREAHAISVGLGEENY